MEGITVQAQEKFISPLLTFRKEQIGSVKATKKAFEKATTKLCVAQVKLINIHTLSDPSSRKLFSVG